MTRSILLRDVTEADLPIFFEQQLDPAATDMAAFPARDRDAFMTHWAKIVADTSVTQKTIVFDGQVAGNIVCFGPPDEREVGYWLGRAYWGKGIATQALSAFLNYVTARPLFAHVAKHNLGSIRVLENCPYDYNTMTHPLVKQLRFTRSEFKRALSGLTDDEASKRFLPMNCISWNVGHLAWQEQQYFLVYGQGKRPLPDIEKRFAYGAPASTPLLGEMLAAWSEIISAADPWLDAVTSEKLRQHVLKKDGTPAQRIFGSLLQRVIYHYWYHTGENMAIRQLLGHSRLPQFVGNIDDKAPYLPEA